MTVSVRRAARRANMRRQRRGADGQHTALAQLAAESSRRHTHQVVESSSHPVGRHQRQHAALSYQYDHGAAVLPRQTHEHAHLQRGHRAA